MYLDGDDLFLRALLPGSDVSSSRLEADMPRHENYRAHANARTHTHLFAHSHCLSLGKSVCLCTTIRQGGFCDRSSIFG